MLGSRAYKCSIMKTLCDFKEIVISMSSQKLHTLIKDFYKNLIKATYFQ